jgi:protease PrsW
MHLLALALAPIALIFTYIYWNDRHEREPIRYLIASFLLGILTAFPVVFLGTYLSAWTGISSTSDDPLRLWVYAFGIVAAVEEGMKFLVLRFYNYPKREFDEPYDGIMYSVAVSLGFAAIENVLYVFGDAENPLSVGVWRMFTAVPAHAIFAVVMGYYAGKAKFAPAGQRTRYLLTGLCGAILFHGFYDYCLFLGDAAVAIGAFASLVVGVVLARRALRAHAARSPHQQVAQPIAEGDDPHALEQA